MNTTHCPNRNHNLSNPPVSFCPSCGAGVNDRVAIKECTEQAHAGARLRRTRFCVDCGERLISS
jgi:ribosomal protein S27AE